MTLETPEYKEVYGDESKVVLFHWHEMFHYYLGSKYFIQNGYKGLYESALLADSELENPRFNHVGLRSLSNPMYEMTYEEGIAQAQKIFRPRFTDQRWEAFKKDLQSLEEIGREDDINGVIWDAGYNPPPTWAVFGTSVAKLIPVTEDKAWLGDMRPYWYQAHWIPFIDVAMLSIALGIVAWVFGPLAAAGFIFIYTCSVVAQYNWTTGSFFRWTWLCELMIGTACLKNKRMFTGGIFMGLSAVDRIFPTAFMIGATLPMLWNTILKRNPRPLIRYTAGAFLAITVMVSISIALFGTEAWEGFYEKITLHKDTVFTHSIGYMRLAVFGQDMMDMDLSSIEKFRIWNEFLASKWHSVHYLHYPIIALLLGACIIAAMHITAEESALLFGGMLFFTTQVTTGYYYIYLPVIIIVMMSAPQSRVRDYVILSVFAFQTYTWFVKIYSYHHAIENFYICIGVFIMLGSWAIARAYETIHILQTQRHLRTQQAV